MTKDSRKLFEDVILKWMPNPLEPAEEDCWAPEIEKASRDKIKEIQSEKLEAAFRYIYEYSPYYSEKYKKAGLTPNDIKSIDDIHKIPVTDKDDMRKSIAAHPPWGNFSCIDEKLWKTDGWIVFLTTGTSGAPVPVRHTQFDRVSQSWHLARQWWMSDVKSDDFVMYCVPFTTHIHAWIHYTAQETARIPMLGAGAPVATEARIDYIEKYKPTVLVGTPTYMIYLGETMKEKGLDPKATSVRIISCAGEAGGSLLQTRRRLMDLWDADVGDLFGTTEAGGVGGHAQMCSYEMKDHGRHAYLHYAEDAGIPEILDPDTLEPLPEGEFGTLIWSGVSSIAQPILRFNVKDIANIKSIECGCGRTMRMSEGGIVGRADDMIVIRGVNVFPTNIEEAVRDIDGFGNEYRIKIVEERGLPDLIVEAEIIPDVPEKDHDHLVKELQSKIKDKCQIRVSVELVPFGFLPRSEFKAKRVMDLRETLRF